MSDHPTNMEELVREFREAATADQPRATANAIRKGNVIFGNTPLAIENALNYLRENYRVVEVYETQSGNFFTGAPPYDGCARPHILVPKSVPKVPDVREAMRYALGVLHKLRGVYSDESDVAEAHRRVCAAYAALMEDCR